MQYRVYRKFSKSTLIGFTQTTHLLRENKVRAKTRVHELPGLSPLEEENPPRLGAGMGPPLIGGPLKPPPGPPPPPEPPLNPPS